MAEKLTLVIATGNPHKLEELQQLLEPVGWQIRSSKEFEGVHEVIEDRPTLEGNAIKKAMEIQEAVKLPVLADDTGLFVDALNGEPGVFSARYAGEDASYHDNVEKLLKELESIPDDNRTARFKTIVAYANGAKVVTFEGVCEGRIIASPRGEKGFGYDPVFVPEGHEYTFAELSEDEKNALSHRGRALKRFKDWLKRGEF